MLKVPPCFLPLPALLKVALTTACSRHAYSHAHPRRGPHAHIHMHTQGVSVPDSFPTAFRWLELQLPLGRPGQGLTRSARGRWTAQCRPLCTAGRSAPAVAALLRPQSACKDAHEGPEVRTGTRHEHAGRAMHPCNSAHCHLRQSPLTGTSPAPGPGACVHLLADVPPTEHILAPPLTHTHTPTCHAPAPYTC